MLSVAEIFNHHRNPVAVFLGHNENPARWPGLFPMENTMTHAELVQAKLGIANRLREARISKGLTQDKLSKLVGTNQAFIHKIENGEVWHPSVIAELAVALDVNPAWLQWGEPFSPMQIDYCQIDRYPK